MTTRDVGEGVEGEAEVFGEKVAAEFHRHAVEDALQMFVGTSEGVVMASGGNNDVVLCDGGDVGGLKNGGFECFDAFAGLGGNFKTLNIEH